MEEKKSSKVKEIIDTLLKKLNSILPKIRNENNETKRYLYLLAWLNKELEERDLGKIIITGGFAVEIYTGRIYRTMDVDLIIEGPQGAVIIEEILKRLGERIARGYLLREESLIFKSIDVVSCTYGRSLEPIKLEVNGLWLYLDPPEELITIYLAGWKFWGSTEDRDKALWLLVAMEKILNIDILKKLAKQRSVEDKLQELLDLLKKHTLRS